MSKDGKIFNGKRMNYFLFLGFLSLFFLTSCGGSSNSSEPAKTSTGLTLKFSDNSATQMLNDDSNGIEVFRDNTITSNNPAYLVLKNIKADRLVRLEGVFTKLEDGSIQQHVELPDEKVKVNIDYKANGPVWEIKATIESLLQEDRGWELQFHLPLSGNKWKWETGLNASVPLDGTVVLDPAKSTWYPLTCLSDDEGSISLGIPVVNPVITGFSFKENELITKFSMGTSPVTKNANKASATMNVWVNERNTGFRQALSDYYERYDEYFKRTVENSGLWTTGTPERQKVSDLFLFHEHGNIFFSNEDSSARDYTEQINIDKSYNLLTLPYLHIGQMSRTNLDDLPADNLMLNQFLDNQSINVSPQQLTKYDELYKTEGLNKWTDALDHSSTLDDNLNPNVRIRETLITAIDENREVLSSWETIGKQVSFVVNPDPEIINGHGESVLKWVEYILDKHPDISGIYIDSISGWPQFKNYNREHFALSDFPLASDELGNIYLPNAWGHIELLLELKALLHPKGKFLMGNGYLRRIDSFFLSSTMDVLGKEDKNSINQTTLFGRAIAGIRPQVKLSTSVDIMSDDRVKQYVNSALALGVLPSAWGSYFAKEEWVNSDESFATGLGGLPNYTKHEAHWLRILKVLDFYKKMKWEPVTWSSTETEDIHLERFSLEDKLFITVYRLKENETDTILIELDGKLLEKVNPEATDVTNDKKYNLKVVDGKEVIQINLDKSEASLAVLSFDLL